MPVCDASIVVDWIAPVVNPPDDVVDLLKRMQAANAAIVGPVLLLHEVSNALLTGVRQRRWSGTDADESFRLLRAMAVTVTDVVEDLGRAWDLSRRYDEHPIYDMVYVALAERLGERLFTADQRLLRRVAGLDFVVGPDAPL